MVTTGWCGSLTGSAISLVHGHPAPSLTGMSLIHRYTTGFWVAAAIFGAGAVICGTLFRSGPLGASGSAAAAPAGGSRPAGQRSTGHAQPAQPAAQARVLSASHGGRPPPSPRAGRDSATMPPDGDPDRSGAPAPAPPAYAPRDPGRSPGRPCRPGIRGHADHPYMRPTGRGTDDGQAVYNGGYACASSARGGSGASWAQRIAGGVTAPPLPAAVPAGSGLSSEGPSDLFWRG